MIAAGEARAARRRQAKRYDAAIKRLGLCAGCTFGERSEGVHHCKNNPGRHHGACLEDKRLPTFRFRPEVLERFTDDAVAAGRGHA